MAPYSIAVIKVRKYVSIEKKVSRLKSMYNFSFFNAKIPLDIFLHTWSTCLFQFKVLDTKIPKSFCSVIIYNFELFIMRLRLKLSIDLVCFCLVDTSITIAFVFSTLMIIVFTWHHF